MLSKSLFKKPKNAPEGAEKISKSSPPSLSEEIAVACPSCKALLISAELQNRDYVCIKCGYHFKIRARQRIAMVVDKSSFEELDAGLRSGNPIHFPDYLRKLNAAQLESAEAEAVICGLARIGGYPTAIFAMEPFFMMGSMGTVVGEKITRLFETATRQGLPVVGFTVSGGARMQEGILSLMQMAKTSGAVKLHSDAGLLYITVLTDPTTGGVTASFAMEGDIILAEPGALIGFAGPRVIEQTIRQKLPEGFQRAEFLLEKGFVDEVVHRRNLRLCLTRLLMLHSSGGSK